MRSVKIIAIVAMAAISSGAANAAEDECSAFPKVALWGSIDHGKATRYVAGKHDGDWSPYVKKWQRQLTKVKGIWDRGGSIVFKKQDVKLEGDALGTYVEQLDQRVSVIECLAKQDEIRTAEASDLASFSTAAGGPQDTQIAARVEGGQLSKARAALKTAEKALRAGNWDKFGAAMQRLKEVLGE